MARIVIVGLGTSGFAAILAAKKTDRAAEITVIDDKTYDLMHPCGLPYAVEGVIGDFDELMHPLHLEKMKVDARHPCRATVIDAEKKTVAAENVDTGEKFEVGYDSLVFSTGAKPFVPPVPGLREFTGKGVFTVSSPAEAEALKASAREGERAVCLGAGAIGLETAVALKKRGMEVTVVEMLDNVMPRALDPDMAGIVKEHLESLGIEVVCGKSLDEVGGGDTVEYAVAGGEKIECSIVIAAAGVRANVEPAASAGAEVGKTGIVVDENLMTTLNDVYAAGDCVQTKSVIDGADFTLQLSTTAYRQGTVAGTNAAGGRLEYPGVSGAFVTKVGKLEASAVGYTLELAKGLGYKTVFGKIKDTTLYDWYPGGKEITVKVIADNATGKVLGAQAVGEEGAASRINVISTAVAAGMEIDRVSSLEMAYCPPVSQAYDPLIKAVDLAIRKRNP